jgi:hypothetical protein
MKYWAIGSGHPSAARIVTAGYLVGAGFFAALMTARLLPHHPRFV